MIDVKKIEQEVNKLNRKLKEVESVKPLIKKTDSVGNLLTEETIDDIILAINQITKSIKRR
jgi:hypothetical protein